MRSCAVAALACAFVLGACGRVGFSDADAGIDASSDAGSASDADPGIDANEAVTDAATASLDARVLPPCEPLTEICNGIDDDCDGEVDEDFDLGSLAHCGECGRTCPGEPPNGAPVCRDGACAITCDRGFADCDGEPRNGCEADVADPENCGRCGNVCPGATPLCEAPDGGKPRCVSICAGGLTRCGDTCVDLATDPSNCRMCRLGCTAFANSSPTCVGGTCGFTCDRTFADCDRVAATGCEESLESPAHCGRCENTCALPGAISGCRSGMCYIASCTADRVDCDGMDVTGCEATGVLAWPDADLDGSGSMTSGSMRRCSITPGWSDAGDDCDDDDRRAFPGQRMYYDTARTRGGFDFNCDGRELPQWRDVLLCFSGPMCVIGTPGWRPVVPACGVTGEWVTDCGGAEPCIMDRSVRTQACL